MGVVRLCSFKDDQTWNEIVQSADEQALHEKGQKNSEACSCFGQSLCGFGGLCCWGLRSEKKTTSLGISDRGTLISGNNTSTQPGQDDVSGQPVQYYISGSTQKSEGMESSTSVKEDGDAMMPSQLRNFSYLDLKSATRNFRPDSLLGEGGFGCVYKGWVDEHGTSPVKPGTGLTVAVKTLNSRGLQGHKEWLAEITYLGQLRHPNLVKLIGFCIEDDKRLLVYEFMQRGSLENHLFRRTSTTLSWDIRIKIALGAAKGVEFLHSRERPVIYRDFKTSNILLDGDYTAKLSDFGLAKDGPQGDKSHVSTRVMGTYGYAAPEYVMTGHLSAKSDIYSFGVVLLELLTGKRSMDKTRPNGEQNLAAWARPYLNRDRLLEIIDPRLERNYSVKGAVRAGQLAFMCLNRDPKSRPPVDTIVKVLEEIQQLQDMPPSLDSGGGNINHKSVNKSLSSGFWQKLGKCASA
ncbi:hypothetical protein KP509_24G053800 [Ceratopteris richardii]|uniref:non-specific serine/threonine protein kinase n=1 Tax=Ceratopteris richardii TaxID=49495 RepID=A0A8T2RVF5_CERRI|nr:hypothetical protein KP509_24G053800 [Ceratopteris richardii]